VSAPASVPRRPGSWAPVLFGGALAVLVVASWWVVVAEQGDRYVRVFAPETLANAERFLSRLAGAGERQPAWSDPHRWLGAGRLALDTLAMSVLAMGFAAAGALLTVMAGARPVLPGDRGPGGWVAFGAVRLLWVFARAVPELIWALLVVFVFSPGILAGALALGIHNAGVLGRLCAETVENLDQAPLRAVRSPGASRGQALLYAVLPSAMPAFLTWTLYRWEVVIRTTVVVGAVSAAGLGREFRLRMSFFHYSDVLLLLLVYVLLVFAVDAAAGLLRRLAR
jgi:phosphonate transport system permease protein